MLAFAVNARGFSKWRHLLGAARRVAGVREGGARRRRGKARPPLAKAPNLRPMVGCLHL